MFLVVAFALKGNLSQKLNNTTASLALGEMAEHISAHLVPFYGCLKLSSCLLPINLNSLVPNLTLQLPNLVLRLPNLVQLRVMERPSWIIGDEGSAIGD